jgi:diguanylate cyclase (GGDEF)-like protein
LSSSPTTSETARVPRYPPLEQFFGPSAVLGAQSRHGRLTPARLAARLRQDSVFRLAVAVAIPVLLMESLSGEEVRVAAIAIPIGFVALQLILTVVNRPPRWWGLFRLGLCLLFVLLANVAIDTTGSWPLNALVIPVVALAASIGGPPALALAALGIATALIPLATSRVDAEADRSAVAIAMAAIVMAIGSRRIVSTLERSAARLRQANARDRRRARQFGALEAVGHLLAHDGTTRDALDSVMALLEDTFGYHYPSIYLRDGANLRLAACHNYDTPIDVVPADKGVIGRTVRTAQPVLLRDAPSDPDFWSADPAIVDEISVPLIDDGEVFGVLNVEADIHHRLDEDDFATMVIVGDRIAAAMALGRERRKLTERTDLLGRLTDFAERLSATLEPERIHEVVAAGAARVVDADIAVVIVREQDSDEYRSIAIDGADRSLVGTRLRPGDGVAGRAIQARSLVVDDEFHRIRQTGESKARAALPDVFAAMGVPMLIGDEVIGGIGFYRNDPSRPFTPMEQEIAVVLANRVAASLTNAALHHEAQELAITDPLTGLHNRRHFDTAVAHADALRERLTISDRRARSAILFDLDHFGSINKRHGHQIGDQILRSFADVLHNRVRASDLTARYGGEEFVVILDGANRDEAVRLADEIRLAFRQQSIAAADADLDLPITTVSAGCASLDRIEVSGAVLLERADVGLAMAKAAGRDQVVAA